MDKIKDKIERLKENIEILKIEAKKFGFKDDKNEIGENIKDYLSTKKYYTYLKNSSKIKGIKETQRFCLKHLTNIIDRKFREEVRTYKYDPTYKNLLLKPHFQKMLLFKEELKDELKQVLT